ncbi:MAG: helix-turn-helix transcriptional regulator [Chroococcidiopsidaceae cyanobacterium CP_BM_ER_R8_30]|nr:helix-turn-helix transcriptional regulator [Chroococcidiopsidaceae cyanobacterium CP_BM_ER_R8_30]
MPKTACVVTPLPTLSWPDRSPESPQVWVSRYTSQPHTPPSRSHTHAFFELLFVEAGEGWHKIGERQLWAQVGDLFVVAPGEVHDPSGLDRASKWIVAFSADALNLGQTEPDLFLPPSLRSLLYSQQVKTRHLHIPPQELPRWLLQLQQLQQELGNKHLGFTEAARALLMLLLIDIARLVQTDKTLEPELLLPKCSAQSRPLLAKVFRFIETNYCQPIGLSEVAKAVNFSPAYLTDLVRRETGRTVLEWIVERRMVLARRLLLETDESVNQIVQTVGYLDPGHFIRLFRRLHGTTPQAWRLSHRN